MKFLSKIINKIKNLNFQFFNKKCIIINLIYLIKLIPIGMAQEYVKKIFKISTMVKRSKS